MIPLHLCQCGCGQPTTIAKKTDRRLGCIKGQPLTYRPGHSPIRKQWLKANRVRQRARQKQWTEANHARVSAQRKQNRAENPEKYRAYKKRWRDANPEKSRAAIKRWHKANPERYKALKDAWREAHPQYGTAQVKAWRAANPEHYNATHTAWYQANRERHQAKNKTWRATNPEKLWALDQRRRARLANVEVEEFQRDKIWERDCGICGICGMPADPTDWHADHIIPVDPGPHTLANMQVSHPICNIKKGRRLNFWLSPAPDYRRLSSPPRRVA